MKSIFTFQNFPVAIIFGLVALGWLSFFSVVLFGSVS